MKFIFPLALLAAVLCSCGNSKVTGVTLSTTPLFGSENGSDKIRMLPTGTTVEYGGEGLPGAAPGTRVKVKFNGTDGYVEKESIIFNGKAAVMKTAIKNPDEDFYVSENGFIVYDSSADNKVHIYHWSTSDDQWTDANNVDIDTSNVVVAAMIDALQSGQCDAEARNMLGKIASSHPTHPFLGMVKVNLSEAPVGILDQAEKKFSDLLINRSKNEIISSAGSISSWLSSYLTDIFALPPDGQEPDEYNNPRIKYFYNYICALPSFVELRTKSIAFNWRPPKESDSLKSFLLYRLDRSPENIKRLYDVFKPVIVDVVSSPLTQDVRPDINALIKVYDRIAAMPNHRALMTDIGNQIAQWDLRHTDASTGINDGVYTLFEQASIYEPIMDTQQYDPARDAQGIWYSSFWTRRFAEGNEKVVYDILKDLSKVERTTTAAVATGAAEDESNETELIECVFQDYSIGDCGHMEFSCGDYGDADTSALSEAEQTLWNDLVLADSEGERGNPKYVGKTFSVRVGTTTGPACNEGQGGEGQVPKILEFKLLD